MIATVNFIRRERRLRRIGAGFLIDLSIVALAIPVALVAQARARIMIVNATAIAATASGIRIAT